MNKSVSIMATGFHVPVSTSNGSKDQDCISLSVVGGRIIISIFKHGQGLSAWIGGEQIDEVAGSFADMVLEATRFDEPDLRVMQ